MVLVHDDDLEKLDRISNNTVSPSPGYAMHHCIDDLIFSYYPLNQTPIGSNQM